MTIVKYLCKITSMSKYKLNIAKPSTITLFILVAFASTNSAFIGPAIPHISQYFGITSYDSQSIVTYFIFGYMFGQLIYGPLSGKYGKKPALYIGIMLCLIGNLGCFLSNSFYVFEMQKIFRVLTGIGAGSGIWIVYSMINDFYYESEARRVTSVITLSFVLLPAISIFASGFITAMAGWQYCYLFMAIYCFSMFLLVRRLPETQIIFDNMALNPKIFLPNYLKCLDKNLISYAIIYGAAATPFYLYTASAPLVVINQINDSAENFGVYSSTITTLGYLLGNFFAIKFNGKYSAKKMLVIASVMLIIGTILLFLLEEHNYFNSGKIFCVVYAIIYFSQPIFFSNAATLALSQAKDRAMSSAAFGFVNLLIPIVSLNIGTFSDNHSQNIYTTAGIISLIIASTLLFSFIKDKNNAPLQDLK